MISSQHINRKYSHPITSQANWESYLKRLVDTYWVDLEHCPSPFTVPLISQDGVELTKNLSFNELPLSDKIDLFYALCDYRLWCEDATEALKDYSLEELRLESIGKDSQGYEYWYFSGPRLFRENKELSQDLILRKKRIKELEYKLIELEKSRIFREKEEKRKAELEKARQQAAEAREARLAAKQQQEQEAKEHNKRRKQSTPILPPRTGLRERRSSATSNNNESQMRTTRSRLSQQLRPQQEQTPQQSAQKTTRGSKNTRQSNQRDEKPASPDLPKKDPEEECKEELQQLLITKEDRAEAWSLHCESLESWESFATKFEKTKSINEKYLVNHVNENLLPHIRAIYAKKAAEAKRKEKELLLSLTSRRVSTRIISKRAQEEEEERQAQLHEAEVRRKKAEAETRLRAELEREMRAKKNRQLLNGGTSSTCSEDGEQTNDINAGRYNLRQQPAQQHLEPYDQSDEFDGIIHPDKLSEFYEALELVVDTVRTSKHAWPFVDPVPETVPGYYDLIKEPMNLRKLRAKIEFREYKSLIELEKDFQLLVNNCEKYNGPKNIYTKMVYKLWKSFRKNVRLYLQRDLFMDENETFIYPPVVAPPRPPLPPPTQQLIEQKQEHQVESNSNPVNSNHNDNVVQELGVTMQSQNNHVSQTDVKPPITRESASPCPPQMSPVNSPEPSIEFASQVHEATKATSPSPAKIPRLEEHVTNSKPHQIDQDTSAPTLPCNQVKEEPLMTTISEEIIIDSYDVDCPDDIFFICPQETKSDEKVDN